jgi:hypothetical protein
MFADFLNFSTRLAPVPEEAPEEILKAIEYPIMGNSLAFQPNFIPL